MRRHTYLLVGIVVFVLLISFSMVWFNINGRSSYESSQVSVETVTSDSYGRKSEMNVFSGSADDEQRGGSVAKINDIRLIIKTGSMALVVKDVRESAKTVSMFAIEKGGFVVSSQVYETGIAPTANITIRIPSEVFDTGVGEIKKLGDVTSESISGEDVTEEYVDLNAQLKNLRATEEQFLTIMRQAVKIQDILDVQRELSNVRGQIERITGRVKFLEQSAKLSTLTVYLSTDPSQLPTLDTSNKWKPLAVAKDAARYLVEAGKMLGNIIIWLVVFIPLWLILSAVVHLVIKKIKKMRNK